MEDAHRLALGGRRREPVREPPARRVGEHVALGVERLGAGAARAVDRRLVLGRRDLPRPREQHARALDVRRGHAGLDVGPLVADQHARQLADVLPAGLDRQ